MKKAERDRIAAEEAENNPPPEKEKTAEPVDVKKASPKLNWADCDEDEDFDFGMSPMGFSPVDGKVSTCGNSSTEELSLKKCGLRSCDPSLTDRRCVVVFGRKKR